MHILHIIPGLSESYGGPSKIAGEMGAELQRQGLTIEIASTDADINGNITIPLNQTILHNGVPARFFHSPFLQKYGFSPGLLSWIKTNGCRYDIVHFHGYFSFILVAAWWCKIKRWPYIIRPLGQLDPWAYAQRSWLKRLFFWLFGRAVLDSASAIHVTSQKEYEGLAELGLGKKCVIIPHGIHYPEDVLLVDRCETLVSRPNLLFLSRIDVKKGLPVLIEAVRQLYAQRMSFTLTVAGAGDKEHERAIRAAVMKSSLQDIVDFVGFVSGSTKEKCFVQADVFVLPSYDENFGVAVTEAMAYGLPVIVSDGVALAQDVLGAEAGLVVPVGTSEKLADAIQYMLLNPAQRSQMGENARKLIRERFTWKRVGQQLIALYSDILTHLAHKPSQCSDLKSSGS